MQIRYFAAAKAATGLDSEDLQAPESLEILLQVLSARHPVSASASAAPLELLLPRCSFLRNGVAARPDRTRLLDSDTIDVLPPFAGG